MRRWSVPLLVLPLLAACGPGERGTGEPHPPVVVVQDGSFPDALSVVSPGVLGLTLGLDGIAEVRVLDVSQADAVDPASVSAVAIAPFTDVADVVVGRWAASGVPVVGLSELGGTPTAGTWRRFVVPLDEQIRALADAAALRRPTCVAGEDSPWSRRLTAGLLRRVAGVRRVDATGTTASGCASVVWTGSAPGAVSMRLGLDRAGEPEVPLIVDDAARTQGYLDALLPATAGSAVGVCACADLAGGQIAPDARRFLHDYIAANGLSPGPFAAEGFDAGVWLSTVLAGARPAAAMPDAIAGPYRWDARGELIDAPVRCTRAAGVRWIVDERSDPC